MKRRDFLVRTACAALVAATPAVVLASSRGTLLEDPQSWVGVRFRMEDGALVELAAVEQLACDRHCTQLCLQFNSVSGAVPPEGIHVMSHASGRETLFLQTGHDGPVAHVNRLHRRA